VYALETPLGAAWRVPTVLLASTLAGGGRRFASTHRYPDPNVYIPPLNPAVTMPTGLRARLTGRLEVGVTGTRFGVFAAFSGVALA
jgi:hypothetical protein